ncbi:MAG: glycine-rich domain-containing protein [Algoriphagus sp.]|uniref:beta strand repeat-containing protein n=1 Tax=Algoriphagus sp. TaxID=1872435 RepID=UPI003296AD1E
MTLTSSGGSCGITTTTKTITVNPNPTVTPGPALAAICQGQISAPMGGGYGGGVTGGSWSGGAGTWTNANNPATATYTAGPTESGLITLTLTSSGGSCGTTTTTKTITVNPNPTVTPGPALAAICQGQTSAPMGGGFGGGATGGTWSGGAGTWTNANNPATATYTAGPTESGSITLTLTSSGGTCGTTTTTKTITVNQNPTANAGTPLFAICQGQTSAPMGGSVGGDATGGTWSGGAGTWTNANNPATATYTASASESGNIALTLTTSGGLCGSVTVTKNITVNQNPIINVGSTLPAICQGQTSVAMGGNVSGGATTGTWSGGTGTWTNANNPATATYTASPSESGSITLTLTASNGSCVSSSTKTITVNPNPVVNAGPALAAICQGQQSAAMGGSVTVGASALWSGGAGTWTNATNAATARYTAGASESGVITLTLMSTLGSCTVTSTKTITINPNPTVSSGTAFTSPICQGQPSPPMGGSVGPGGATALWTGGAGTWSNATNAATATYTPSTSESGTITLTLTASLGTCSVSTTKTITVNQLPTVTATPASQFRCDNIASGTIITLSPAPRNLAGTTYEWSRTNPVGLVGTGAGTALSGTTSGTTLVGTFKNNTTSNITTTYTITPIGPAPSFCRGVPVNVNVTIYAPQVAPVVSSSQTVCVFNDPALLVGTAATGGSNNYTYQWQRRASSTGWTTADNIAGATGITYQPPTTNPFNANGNNWYYRLVATDQCGVVVSNIIFVEVINDLNGLSFPAQVDNSTIPSSPICPGTSFAPEVETPGHFSSSAVRYSWTADPNFISPSTGGPIGTTSAPFFFGFFRTSQATLPSLTATNNTNATVTTTITITPRVYNFSTGAELCSSSPTSFTVRIRPTPVLTATPASSNICSGGSTAIALSSNITDNPTTYSWTASLVSGSATGFSNQTSFVAGPINQTLTNTGSTPAVVRYVITPRSSNCTGATRTVDITVNPTNTITRTSAAATTTQTICSGIAITPITYTTTGATGATVSGLPSGVTGVWSGNVLTISGTPNVPAGGSFNYAVSMTGGCTSGQVAPTGTITVLPIHTITAAANRSVCRNAAMSPITMTLGGGATGATVTGLPTGVTSNVSGTTLTISGTPTVSGSFTYNVTTTGNSCATASTVGTITIDPIHTITAASSPTVCQNAAMPPITMTLGGGATGATVSGLPAGVTFNVSGTTLTISGTPTVTGSFNYAVTTTGNTCATATTNGTITVAPIHAITAGSDRTVCQNTPMTPITMTLAGGATGATVTGLPAGVTANVSGTTLTISGTPTVFGPFNYTVLTTGNSCTVATTGGIITVTPVHTITAASNQTVCQNVAITNITMTLGGGATGATVTGLPAGITFSVSGTTLTISGIPTVSGSFPYSVTTTGNACTTATTNGTITVSPIHTISAGSNQTVCQNVALANITLTLGGGATGAIVTGLPAGVMANVSGTTLTISGTPTVSGSFPYTVTTTGNTCATATTTGTITATNQSYPITDIDVLNPSAGSPPYTSEFSVYSGGFVPGTYTVVYNSTGVNSATNQTVTGTVTTNGVLTFNSQSYSNEGTSILEIISIRNNGDNCTYFPPTNTNIPYGVNCSTTYLQSDGNKIFYVPAGVSQVTIQAFGDGSSSSAETMTVVPGGAIFVVFDGSDVFATEVPASEPKADRIAAAIVTAVGPNGRIIFSFDCPTVTPCSSQLDNGSNYIDSEGFTVLRFSAEGPCTWTAPDGLEEFEVLVVGAGGGGGFGPAAGGGGGGAVIYRQYTGITMGGEIGLQNATFNLSIGTKGRGANAGERGLDGLATSFAGATFDYSGSNSFSDLTAQGGAGGGSTDSNASFRQGANGSGDASGGGGAAYLLNASTGGISAGTGYSGGNAFTDSFGSAGAGGGGATGPGVNGLSSGGGTQMNGGNGGNGIAYNISGEATYYGAGGGGTAIGATSNIEGLGGSQYTANSNIYFAGGGATNSGVGQTATTFGSGGGAGGSRGGDGFPGVIYIRYPNYRILPVEYLYFDAKYNPGFRSGDLTWATAKEWENDRFEIERSINSMDEWETIDQVAGAGYSDEPVDYEFRDQKLPGAGGNIFYRLKQVDFDGDSTYSETRAIKVEALPGVTSWRIFPNPTTGNPFNIEILDPSAYRDEAITLRVIAPTGQYELIQVTDIREMGALVSRYFESKAAGVYTIEIAWGARREYHKVILKR